VREARFGSSLAIDGDTLAIGASQEDSGSNARAGAAYVYTHQTVDWTLLQRVAAPSLRAYAQFGFALDLSGDTLVIGAPHNPYEVASDHNGEVYVLRRDGSELKQVALLTAPQPAVNDQFGAGLGLNASQLYVGAAGEADERGAVYAYARGPSGLVRSLRIAPDKSNPGDQFGEQIQALNDYVVVSAPLDDGGARGIDPSSTSDAQTDSGAVYLLQ